MWAVNFARDYAVLKTCVEIVAARTIIGLSWSGIAEETGVSEQTLERINRHDPGLSPHAVATVANFMLRKIMPAHRHPIKLESLPACLRAAVVASRARPHDAEPLLN